MPEAVTTSVPAPAPKDPEAAFSTKQPPAHPPRPTTPDLDPPGADTLGLTKAEISQFRELGFVIKRGLIPPQTFDPIIDLWWQQLKTAQQAAYSPTRVDHKRFDFRDLHSSTPARFGE